MQVIFHPIADGEYWDQVDFYRNIRKELGVRFEQAVEAVVNGIVQNPYLCHNRGAGIFSVRVRGFPFSLFYRIVGDAVFVLSVCHEKRSPGIWKFRK